MLFFFCGELEDFSIAKTSIFDMHSLKPWKFLSIVKVVVCG
jgi:hypothetical protein